MTTQHVHLKKIQEHLQELKDATTIGIDRRPATIGFHTSACSIDLLELYLHKLGKLEIGAQIKHEWFKRPKEGQKIIPIAERKLPLLFPHKEELFEFLYSLEEKRNKLIYGNTSKEEIEHTLNVFERFKNRMKELLEAEGTRLEE